MHFRCETSLLNELGDTGTSQGSELRARINTFEEDGFSTVLVRRHSLRETDSVTVPLIIGTMLDLDEDECESLAEIQKVCIQSNYRIDVFISIVRI